MIAPSIFVSAMSPNERAVALQAEIEGRLPDFAAMVRNGLNDAVVLHQDSFAADYQTDEFALLGQAIKYAGLFGREVRVIGKNRETLT